MKLERSVLIYFYLKRLQAKRVCVCVCVHAGLYVSIHTEIGKTEGEKEKRTQEGRDTDRLSTAREA